MVDHRDHACEIARDRPLPVQRAVQCIGKSLGRAGFSGVGALFASTRSALADRSAAIDCSASGAYSFKRTYKVRLLLKKLESKSAVRIVHTTPAILRSLSTPSSTALVACSMMVWQNVVVALTCPISFEGEERVARRR